MRLLKFNEEMADGNVTGGPSTLTGKSEIACEYPVSLVVAMVSAIKRQTISDGAIRIGEMHFAGPVPDEGDCPWSSKANEESTMKEIAPIELEGKWRVDGILIDTEVVDRGTEIRNGIHEEDGCV